jgi:hypothetical protein
MVILIAYANFPFPKVGCRGGKGERFMCRQPIILVVTSMAKSKSIWFDPFIVETPEGKKIKIHPVNAYAPDYKNHGILAEQKRNEQWYGQFVDKVPEIGAIPEFFDARFRPSRLLVTSSEE